MSTDIETTLNYTKDEGTRPYFYLYNRTEEEIQNSPHKEMMQGTNVEVDVLVRDGRSHNLSLDENSFELVQQTTSLSTKDFYDNPENITDIYYSEIADLVKKATGAAHVYVFHHQVRNKDRAGSVFEQANVQPYAAGVHSDSSPHHAEKTFIRFAGIRDNKEYTEGRFLYINAWRNISDTPIADNHLAVCDETSLVRPDDYILADLFMKGYQMAQFKLSDRNSKQHRWYYFSRMKKDEVLLFKQWDSDTNRPARTCFHSAFSDPSAPDDAPPRESIEVRAFAYFPDHKPNTCPIIEQEKEFEVDENEPVNDEEARKYVKKLINAVEYARFWPKSGVEWVRGELARGASGAKAVAKKLVDDEGNYHGLKNASGSLKARVLELLLKDNFEGQLKANFLKKSGSSWLKHFTLSDAGYLTVGCALGCLLSYVVQQRIKS